MTPLALDETFLTTFLDDCLAGLNSSPKTLPCKYLYDARGSQLFDEICELPEYYPTRTELGIMRDQIAVIGRELGPGCTLIEYGSGSSLKTQLLLDHLPSLAAYVPIDISDEYLFEIADGLQARYPDLPILPLVADFTQPFELPADAPERSRVVYFPGSTIGNFTPEEATALLRGMRRVAGAEGRVLIGVDLKKDPQILEAAYDDARGVTADFNLNLLTRINRELGADFDVDAFEHQAVYNRRLGRVEMHLRCRTAQQVTLGDQTIAFAAGESIHTENSHKFSIGDFQKLAAAAGFAQHRVWTDAEQLFSVMLLCPASND